MLTKTQNPESTAVRPMPAPPSYSDAISSTQFSIPAYRNFSPTSSRSSSEESGTQSEREGANLGKALDFAHHSNAPLPPIYSSRLTKPVALPQVRLNLGSPFARAYPDVLVSHGIRKEEWLEFVDNFNGIMMGSPALQASNVIGMGIGFIPNHLFILAGALVQMGTAVATYAEIKIRCRRFIRMANEEFFEPRGLKVEVRKTQDVARILGVKVEDVMVQPINTREDTTDVGLLDRRLNSMRPYTAPLDFDVPPAREQTNILAKLSTRQSRFMARKMKTQTMKNRRQASEKTSSEDGEAGKLAQIEREEQKDLGKLERDVLRAERRAEKDMRSALKERDPRKREERVRKVDEECEKELKKFEKEGLKINKDAQKEQAQELKEILKEDKEFQSSKKGLWILVRNLDEALADEAEQEKRKAEAGLFDPVKERLRSVQKEDLPLYKWATNKNGLGYILGNAIYKSGRKIVGDVQYLRTYVWKD